MSPSPRKIIRLNGIGRDPSGMYLFIALLFKWFSLPYSYEIDTASSSCS
jgi:hypothetical protein